MQEVKTLKTSSVKINKKSIREVITLPLLSALVSLLCFTVICAVTQKYPLGKYTVVVSDLEAQYAPYLFLLKSKLLNLDFSNLISNFGYSFLLGAGKNFAGTFGYYLASPLNLIVLLFKPTQVNEFILTLMAIKTCLASAFMCAFIQERACDKKSKWPVLWGVMYAFSSYMLLYLFQIMWLDGYYLLPLLLLLIEKYLKNGKLGGITFVLLLLFLSNYYIAYMAGIYSFLYLLGRMYVEGRFSKEYEPVKVIGRFVLRAVFCGLTLGSLLLPVGIDTLANGDPTNKVHVDSYVSFTGIDFINRIFLGYPGEFGDVLIANLPLVFVSLFVTVLCTIYIVSKAFSGKEKRMYLIIFVLIYVMLNINVLDIAWQVFDSPNWFWHRQTFVFINFFMVVSYKAFEKLEEISSKEIIKAGTILGVLLLISQSFGEMKTDSKIFVYNLALISVIVLVLLGMKKKEWPYQLKDMNSLLPKFLVLLVLFEACFISPLLSSGVATLAVFHSEADEYKSYIESYVDCALASNILDNGFRSEYENIYSYDDVSVGSSSCYGQYNGISIFNSNSNKQFGRFLKQLGYKVNYNYFSAGHSYACPDSDAFFSIGSLYCTNDYTDATYIADDDNVIFYRNENVLPLAFAVRSDALDFDFYSLETSVDHKNYFEFRNDWYASMFDSFNEDYFVTIEDGITMETINCNSIDLSEYFIEEQELDEEDINASESVSEEESLDPDNLGLEAVADNENVITYYRTNPKIPIIINYEITVPTQDELYVNYSVPRISGTCDFYLNGRLIDSYSAGTFYSTVLRLGSFNPGDTINFTISADQPSFSLLEMNFAYFDMESFENQFEGINTSNVSINEASDGYVSLHSSLNSNEIILTTIPYEDGWTCFVDGEEASITPYEESLIAIEAGEGDHDIILKFTPPGFKAGIIVSVVGIIGLITLVVIDTKRKNCNNKAQK